MSSTAKKSKYKVYKTKPAPKPEKKLNQKSVRRQVNRQHEITEIALLERRIKAEQPPKGSNPLAFTQPEQFEKAHVYFPSATSFADMPISEKTKQALTAQRFTTMTEIQRAALPHALCGRDVLAAAKTGSGKTLAFLIPVLERLYRERWSPLDGIGAIIISPLRELALQIFEVLLQVGCNHNLSAGLLIGGKDFANEQRRVTNMCILVCTPGRLLQHMNETAGFDCSNVKVLVLDEADRCLQAGFADELNAIVENLPKMRQTLLFSATQTKRLSDLARLSLHEPQYVAVRSSVSASLSALKAKKRKSDAATPSDAADADAEQTPTTPAPGSELDETQATPTALEQHVVETKLGQKLDVLWSFIKSHLRQKVLVFVSTRKQVRYLLQAFSHLRPGVPLSGLQGHSTQVKRMQIYVDFCDKRNGACMFTTDVAARGLDFPDVDWVVQLDAPLDVDTYIHRVGRTARAGRPGKALLLLLPSERALLTRLERAHVPVLESEPNTRQMTSIRGALAAMVAADAALKFLAQKTFISYMRSVFIAKDAEVFDVTKLPVDDYALSLGLVTMPNIKFKKKSKKSSDDGDADGAGNDGGVDASRKRKRTKADGPSTTTTTTSELDAQATRKNVSRAHLTTMAKYDAAAAKGADVAPPSDKSARDARGDREALAVVRRRNDGVLSDAYRRLHAADDDVADEDNDAILKPKRGEQAHAALPPLTDAERRRAKRASKTAARVADADVGDGDGDERVGRREIDAAQGEKRWQTVTSDVINKTDDAAADDVLRIDRAGEEDEDDSSSSSSSSSVVRKPSDAATSATAARETKSEQRAYLARVADALAEADAVDKSVAAARLRSQRQKLKEKRERAALLEAKKKGLVAMTSKRDDDDDDDEKDDEEEEEEEEEEDDDDDDDNDDDDDDDEVAVSKRQKRTSNDEARALEILNR